MTPGRVHLGPKYELFRKSNMTSLDPFPMQIHGFGSIWRSDNFFFRTPKIVLSHFRGSKKRPKIGLLEVLQHGPKWTCTAKSRC